MTGTSEPSPWLDFWNADHSIYVNRRHRDAHARRLFADIVPLLPPAPFTLLDYGCGDALMTLDLVARGGHVLLYERAPAPRAELARRFAGAPGVAVLDEAALATLAPGCCNLVLLISVIQYLDRGTLGGVLGALRPLLSPAGRLVIGDIVGPDTGILADVADLLDFARRNHFLTAAALGLLRTWTSDYRAVRKRAGFTTYTPDQLATLLADHGWQCEVLDGNIGHSRHRRSMTAWPIITPS